MANENTMKSFEKIIEMQLARIEAMKAQTDFIDYNTLPKLIIGVCGGDGIGPAITHEAHRVLETLLADKVRAGKVEFRVIDGLTIENRAAAGKALDLASAVGLVAEQPGVDLDYFEVVDPGTLEPLPTDEPLSRPALALLAARVGPVRLIDNTVLP